MTWALWAAGGAIAALAGWRAYRKWRADWRAAGEIDARARAAAAATARCTRCNHWPPQDGASDPCGGDPCGCLVRCGHPDCMHGYTSLAMLTPEEAAVLKGLWMEGPGQ